MVNSLEVRGISQTLQNITNLNFSKSVIEGKTEKIANYLVENSLSIEKRNFDKISNADLYTLFRKYDQLFFENLIQNALEIDDQDSLVGNDAKISFQFSKRMTKSGGLTKTFRKKSIDEKFVKYEIKISSYLLFQTYQDIERDIIVNGIECHNRLEAMQRIFEHELIHLIEQINWGNSNCNQDRFKSLVKNIFGHTATRHQLVTQIERAKKVYNLNVGNKVKFEFEGNQYRGIISRITKRATVMVPNENGQYERNGKRYMKFYIPLPNLEKIG